VVKDNYKIGNGKKEDAYLLVANSVEISRMIAEMFKQDST
jgi:hypothetical protein